MTPLRFKVWDTINKKWIQSELCYLTHDGNVAFVTSNSKIPVHIQEGVIPVFSTGLRDKNGLLIFKGDICKASKPNSYLDGIYEVAWHEEGGRWYYQNQPSYKDLYQVGCNGNLKCEIIGNIYENPELLSPSSK